MWCNTEKWNNPSSRATGETEQGWSDFTRNPPAAKVYVSTVRAFQNIWLWFGTLVDDIQRENSEFMNFFVWLVGCCFDCWLLTLVLRKPITIWTLDMRDFYLMWKCVKMQKKQNSCCSRRITILSSWFLSAEQTESRIHVQLYISGTNNLYYKILTRNREKPSLLTHMWENVSDLKICCGKGNAGKDEEMTFLKFVQ